MHAGTTAVSTLRGAAPLARDVSPWVRIIVGGVLLVAAVIFLFALRHPQQGPRLRDLSPSGDKWWTEETRPTPVATPRAVLAVAPKPIIIRTQPALPAPTPPTCQICIERAMRYQRAIETGMGSVSTAANTRELAQMVPTPQTTPEPLEPLVIQEQP
jgi:hypothetical protein